MIIRRTFGKLIVAGLFLAGFRSYTAPPPKPTNSVRSHGFTIRDIEDIALAVPGVRSVSIKSEGLGVAQIQVRPRRKTWAVERALEPSRPMVVTLEFV